MKLSTKGQYAIEALLYMASLSAGEPVKASAVSQNTKVSEKYLEQIFFRLRKSGILTTVRGPRGGYLIAKEINTLTCGEIIRAAEGEIAPVPCVKNPANCKSSAKVSCPTKQIWEDVTNAIEAVLDSTSLAMLKDCYLEMKVNI